MYSLIKLFRFAYRIIPQLRGLLKNIFEEMIIVMAEKRERTFSLLSLHRELVSKSIPIMHLAKSEVQPQNRYEC